MKSSEERSISSATDMKVPTSEASYAFCSEPIALTSLCSEKLPTSHVESRVSGAHGVQARNNHEHGHGKH